MFLSKRVLVSAAFGMPRPTIRKVEEYARKRLLYGPTYGPGAALAKTPTAKRRLRVSPGVGHTPKASRVRALAARAVEEAKRLRRQGAKSE